MTDKPIKATQRKKPLSGAELIAQDMEAARLRLKERKQYREIAQILGFKEATGARDAVFRHLLPEQAASSAEARVEILTDLYEVAGILLGRVRQGEVELSDRYIRVVERIVKIEGVDAPVRLEVEDVTDAQIRADAEKVVEKFKSKPALSVVSEAS